MAKRILIVGGGTAGVALALSLRQQGVSPDLIEREPHWPTGGAGIYLLGNATRALGTLGLQSAVLRHGARIETQTLMTRSGRELARIETARTWDSCGPCVGLSRPRLQQLLADAAGPSDIRFATTVTALDERAAETVVTFSDGNAAAYDLVVGADGLRSSIRGLLWPGSVPRFCGQVGWRFTVRCPPTVDGWTLFAGRSGVFLFLPIGGGRAYCYADAMLSAPVADPREGRLDRLRGHFAGYAAIVTDALSQLTSSDQVHSGAIEDIQHRPQHSRRTLLIGDAAHASSPNMAQGAAMALEDAVVLGSALGSSAEIDEAVHAFVNRRTQRVQWVRSRSMKRDRIRKIPVWCREFLTRRFAAKVYAADYAPLVLET